MASSIADSKKKFKRTESKKSHSWWWDSHISPKHSKWLAENLEEMDQSIKRMLKLIEEDGDSFAKKAEMYYQKRPELMSHVEEFYRMYRSLAERYDHVTGELQKNIHSDLQSQGSGISDISSEPSSTSPSPDQRLGHLKCGHRAAFLGSGGSSSDLYNKEGDEMSSSLDSESEYDDSSVNNYSALPVNVGDQGRHRKITELEVELRETKDKVQIKEVENADGSLRETEHANSEDLVARIARYEEELSVAKEKIQFSDEEIARLKIKLQKYRPPEFIHGLQAELDATEAEAKSMEAKLELEGKQGSKPQDKTVGLEVGVSEQDEKIQTLVEELQITKQRLQVSEEEIASLRHEVESNQSSEAISHLQNQLELAQKDIAMWKLKLNSEKREVSKLQERIARYKTSLVDRDHEIRELKLAISDAELNFSLEKTQLQAKISRLIEEQNHLEEMLKEWEIHGRTLEEEIKRVEARKAEMEGLYGAMENRLNGEIEWLKADIRERGGRLEDLNRSLDTLKLKYGMLISERDELNTKVLTLTAEVSSRVDCIVQMDKRLHQLRVERAELIAGMQGAHKTAEELESRVRELQNEVEKQRVLISEGAEAKREAIRQLCFSLEHYRTGYHQLRQAFIGHKRIPILAS